MNMTLILFIGLIIFAVVGQIIFMLSKGKKDSEFIEPKDYTEYQMNFGEWLWYFSISSLFIYMALIIFYQRWYVGILALVIGIIYPKIRKKELIEQQKKNLNNQFKEGLYSLSSSVGAGSSIEQAFFKSIKDLEVVFGSSETFIIEEFKLICNKINNNQPVEEALSDFAERSDLDDVYNFSEVFITTKRRGGNLVEVIQNTTNVIADKITVKREIDTMIAGKKFEMKILSITPFFMMYSLTKSSPDYMLPIFTTFPGFMASSAALLLIIIGYFAGQKIMDIEV